MKTNSYFSLLIIAITTNSNKVLLFCFIFSEYFTWLFNCSLWVRYPSLGTHYYFWQRSALKVISNEQCGVLLEGKKMNRGYNIVM